MEDISESLIDETPSNNSSNVIPYDPRRRYEELLEQVERLGHFSTKTFCVNSSKLESKVSFTTRISSLTEVDTAVLYLNSEKSRSTEN